MNTTAASSIRRDLIPIMIAILFLFFLFWFDERKYDLSWVSNPGTRFFFLIYLGAVVGGELIVSKVLSERIQGRKRIALIVGIGAPFGFGAAYSFSALVRLVPEML